MTRNYLTNFFYIKLIFFLIFNLDGSIHTIEAQPSTTDAAKLHKCRQYDFAETTVKSVASDNESLYVGTEDGSVHAIDPLMSRKTWSSNIGGQVISNLLVINGRILIAANTVLPNGARPTSSILRSLSSETGLAIWNISLPYSNQLFVGVVGNMVISVSQEGVITANEAATGVIQWKASFSGTLTAPPQFLDDRIIFGTDQKEVIVVNGKNGETKIRSKTKYLASAVSSPSAKTIAIGDERGNLVLLDIVTGKTIWKFKSGARITSISPTEKGLLATSNDNFVYMISGYNGDIIWKRRLPGRLAGSPLFTKDVIVLPLNADKSTFLVDFENGKILNQLTMNEPNSPWLTPRTVKENSFVFSTSASVVSYSMKQCGGN